MKKPVRSQAPELSLSIQYGVPAPNLPRWRLRRWVQAALLNAPRPDNAQKASLTIRLVGNEEGQKLNQQFRHRNYATNVLTFEYGIDPDNCLTADIVLCMPVLVQEAREQHKTIHNHAAHLIIHGVFHALGYDHLHNSQAQEMENLETRTLARLGLPDPYRATPNTT